MDKYEVRTMVGDYLANQGKGGARRLADEAGISPGTLSKFRHGIYRGDERRVADSLAMILANRAAAEALVSGQYRTWWLVATTAGLRLCRKAQTVEAIRRNHADAHVVQILLGSQPHDIHFVDEERKSADDGD